MTNLNGQLTLFPPSTSSRTPTPSGVEWVLAELAAGADARRIARAKLTPAQVAVLALRHPTQPFSLDETAVALREAGRNAVRDLERAAVLGYMAASPTSTTLGEAA